MRQKLLALALVAVASLATACTRIGPGYVGIKVSMAGDNKGVNSAVATTGYTFYNPLLTSVYEYPTFVQTAVWTKNPNEGSPSNDEITFSNADQMQIAVDVSLSYHLDPDKVPQFYVKYRSDNLAVFTHGQLRNFVRDAFNEHAGKYHIEQIMGDNAAFLHDVKDAIQTAVTPIGVVIDQFGIIGIPRPPQAVTDAINSKVHATQLAQQKQNELIQVQADMAKEQTKAETYAKNKITMADAEATANRKLAESLNPTLVEYLRTQKWDGKLPQVTSSGSTLFQLK